MEFFAKELLEHVSWGWILGAALIILTLERTGAVQRLFSARAQERIAAEQLESEDQDRLIKHLFAEADYFRSEIARLRGEVKDRDQSITALIETVKLSETGNSRLRHATNNILQYVETLRRQIVRQGGVVPRFPSWGTMLGLSADLDESLHNVFEATGTIELLPPNDQKNDPQL